MRAIFSILVRRLCWPFKNALQLTTGFWLAQKTSIKYQVSSIKRRRRILLGLLVIALIPYTLYLIPDTQSAAGINNQINFQGKIVNPDGTNVADGTYNLQFKIYQDGDGVLGGGDETLKWTEARLRNNSQGVVVTNGIFQVNLGSVNSFGSSIDFNQDTLWLSMQVGGTNATCTPFSTCAGAETEMSPFIRFTSTPYAQNSAKLQGLDSTQFTQLAQGVQTDASTANASIFVNKTGTTANILQLQRGGADVEVIANDGSALFKNQTDSVTGFRIQSATAAQTLFTADTTANKIKIGDSTGTDTATTLLVVDSATANPTTLTGRNGGLFYDSALDQLKVVENGAVARVCTTTSVCSGYAPSAGSGYVQFAPASVQVDSSTNNTVFINKTGASGNIVELQKGGVDKFTIDNNGDTTLGASSSLKLTGGTSFPGSPTEGQIYYRTDTKQLYIYANGQWQADRSTATKIVAASDSQNKEKADYVGDGNTGAANDGDQVEINTAISALPAGGGTVYLLEGTYTIDASISIPSNVTLAGSGAATVITVPNSFNSNINIITNSDTTSGNTRITLMNFRIDGNKANNSSGTQHGVAFIKVGSSSGASAVPGAKITGLTIDNLRSRGIYLDTSNNNTVTGNSVINVSASGFYLTASSSNNLMSGNISQGNSYGFNIDTSSSYNSLTSNVAQGNSVIGIFIGSPVNTITGNNIRNNNSGIGISSSDNTISGNTSVDNTSDAGIYLSGASALRNTVTGNNVQNNNQGIYAFGGASNNAIVGNRVYNSTADNIRLYSGSNSNTVTSNDITDTAGSGTYAINIDSGSNNNYLASNRYSGTGATSINDAGTGTIYGAQIDGSNNIVHKSSGVSGLFLSNDAANTNPTLVSKVQGAATADLFQAQDNGGNALFKVASTGAVTVGRASNNTGKIVFAHASNTGNITVQGTSTSGTFVLDLPAENGTLCSTGSVCAGYAPSATNGYVQLAPASVQGDGTTNNSIFVNKTGASGNIVELQKSGVDKFVINNTGNIGIDTATPTNGKLQIGGSLINPANNVSGVYSAPVISYNSNSGNSNYAGYFQAQDDNNGNADYGTLGGLYAQGLWNNGTTITNLYGLDASAAVGAGASNTVTNVFAINSQITVGSSNTNNITNAKALNVAAPSTGTFGTITNNYGIDIASQGTARITNAYGLQVQAQSGATATNAGVIIGEASGGKNTNLLIGTTTVPSGSYSIYNSSTDQNYFAGNVGIGTASPGTKLHVVGPSSLQAATAGAAQVNLLDSTGANISQLRAVAGANNAFGANSLSVLTTGQYNSAFGENALAADTSGYLNTAVGLNALSLQQQGFQNTAIGANALQNANGVPGALPGTDGTNNTAVGANAGQQITTGHRNTAIGVDALFVETTGDYNTAVGTHALNSQVGIDGNTAVGFYSLFSNVSSTGNVAIGRQALGNAIGAAGVGNNSALGEYAGGQITSGVNNTALGAQALYSPGANFANGTTTGAYQTAVGSLAGQSSATQVDYTVALGYSSLFGGTAATALGAFSNAAHTYGIALGFGATTTATNQLVVGGSSGGISTVYIGNGVTDASPVSTTINATGRATSVTDGTGASLTLAGGKATGNAAGGSILFQTSDPGASGATLQGLTTKMAILANGNIGIGTASPTTKLEVVGSSYFQGDIGSSGLSGLQSQGNNFNILPNASFEVKTTTDTYPGGWAGADIAGNGSAITSWASDSQSDGKYALKSVTTGTTSFSQIITASIIPVKPSTTYMSAIDVRNDTTASNCSLGLISRIDWFTSAGAAASTPYDDVYGYGPSTTSWATYSGTATSPANAAYAKLEYYNFFNTGSCTRWYDNAVFRQVSFTGSVNFAIGGGNVGIGTTSPTQILTLGEGADRTINVETRTSNAAGRGLTIQAGTAGAGASAFTGGTLTLQGGAASGTGNANGANVTILGGAGVGTGVQGLVGLASTAFSAATTQSFGANGTITQANVDNFSTVVISSSVLGPVTVTVPNPINSVVGRILYVTVTGSNSIIVSTPGGTPSFTMVPNSSATYIWNGSVWTNAGVDGGSNSYIQNQNSADQTANFRISGIGTIKTLATNASSGSGNGDDFSLTTGSANTGNNNRGGAITIKTGDALTGNNRASGDINVITGVSQGTSNSGSILIDTGVPGGSGAAGAISIGHVGVTTTSIGSLKVGSSAGSGTLFTNNGATLNATLAVTDRTVGSPWLSGASSDPTTTVDKYTSFTVNQSTTSITVQVPSPTLSTSGRIIYVANIGSTSFTLLGATLNNGSTATLMWNGTAWTFAGADGSSILNQNTADQSANFRITGSGRANTSFLTPLLDAAASATALDLGTTNANQINLNQNTTIAAAKTLTVTSALTSLTGATSGDALNVSNSTSAGNIAVFKSNATTVASIGTKGNITFSPVASTSGTPTILTVTAPAHTGLTNAEAIDANLNLARTVTFTGGAATSFATQRALVVQAPTYAATTGTLTITDAATQAITGAPVKGSNVAITNSHALLIQSGAVSAATNSYGLTVNAQTGATNNYAAEFLGGNVGIGTSSPTAQLHVVAPQPTAVAGAGTAATQVLQVTGGKGGNTTGTTTTAGAGSSSDITAGAGGNATDSTANTALAGTGGNISFLAGAGGTNSSTGNRNGAAAGTISLTSGAGGNATGSGNNSNGGLITLQGGAAGTGGGGTAGARGNISLQASGGNVGIGNSSPVEALDVTGNISGSNKAFIPAATGTNGQGYFIRNATPTPIASFQALDLGGNTYSFLANNKYYNGTAWVDDGLGRTGSSFQIQNDMFTFYSFDTGTSFTNRLQVASGGNVGIGTNNLTPSSTLQVLNNTGAANALQVQNSIGANAVAVETNAAVNLALNSGGETGGTPPTSWAAHGAATVTQDVTAGEFASGAAGIKAATTGSSQGARNNVGTAMAASSSYVVSFSMKASVALTNANVTVRFSPDGSGSNNADCSTYTASYNPAISTSNFIKYTCTLTTTSTTTTASAYLAIFQADATSRSIFIDNLSIVLQNSSGTQNVNTLRVGGANSQGLTLLTLDTSAGTPFTGTNTALVGSMYFDTTSGKIQCYDGSVWGACGAAPNGIVTITPEYAGAVLNGTGIGTLTSDFCANQAGVLVVPATGNICSSGDARNFYKWTSIQPSAQAYSMYVTYKLPSTFKNFVDNNTISLTARTDNTTNGIVAYELYKSTGTSITACGTSTTVTSSINTWQTVNHNGNESTTCAFAANNYVIFKITMTASNSANVYVENLNFSYTNQ